MSGDDSAHARCGESGAAARDARKKGDRLRETHEESVLPGYVFFAFGKILRDNESCAGEHKKGAYHLRILEKRVYMLFKDAIHDNGWDRGKNEFADEYPGVFTREPLQNSENRCAIEEEDCEHRAEMQHSIETHTRLLDTKEVLADHEVPA